jgi:hypothetical protein
MIEVAVALATAEAAVEGIKKAISIGRQAKDCLGEFMSLFDAQDQIQKASNEERAKKPAMQQEAAANKSAMSEALESVIAARRVREMTEELRQYLIWSGQGDVWDEIHAEHNAVVQRRKAAELAAQREKERLEKQRKERALLAVVVGLGGIILYHISAYIYEAWPR